MTRFSFHRALIVCTMTLAGGAALADDITMAEPLAMSTRSRAEVLAELHQAIADGGLIGGGELALPRLPAMPTKSALARDQVRLQVSRGAPSLSAMLSSHGAP